MSWGRGHIVLPMWKKEGKKEVRMPLRQTHKKRLQSSTTYCSCAVFVDLLHALPHTHQCWPVFHTPFKKLLHSCCGARSVLKAQVAMKRVLHWFLEPFLLSFAFFLSHVKTCWISFLHVFYFAAKWGFLLHSCICILEETKCGLFGEKWGTRNFVY